MELTGERFIPSEMTGVIEIEHMQRYLSILELVKGKVVLDAACGEGYGSNLMADVSTKVYGIDISEEAICWAKDKYTKENLSYFKSSVEKLPFEDHFFDVIVSFETIEHVNSDIQHAFLKEVKRVLKKDGIFIISTPDKKNYSDIPRFNNEFHVKEFYYDEFDDFLRGYFPCVNLLVQGERKWSVLAQKDQKLNDLSIHYSNETPVMAEGGRYIVAICSSTSNNEHVLNVQSIMPLTNDSQEYLSYLYIDFGGGYHKDVKVISNVSLNNNNFEVIFKKLNPLNIKGLKWIPIIDRCVNISPKEIYCDTGEAQLVEATMPDDVLVNEQNVGFNRCFDVICEYENLNELKFTGQLTIGMEKEAIIDLVEKQKFISDRFTEKERVNEEITKELNRKLELLTSERETYLATNETITKELNNIIKEKETLNEIVSKLESNLSQIKVDLSDEVMKCEMLNKDIFRLESDLEKERGNSGLLESNVLELKQEIELVNSRYNEVINSNSWKMTKPLRSVGRSVRSIAKSSVIVVYKRLRKMKMKRLVKWIYRRIPLSATRKEAVKDFVYTKFAFALKDSLMYRAWKMQNDRENTGEYNSRGLESGIYCVTDDIHIDQPGRIAIHIHMYYVDLLKEFVGYLNNMPYKFDVYISIMDKEQRGLVAEEVKKITNLENAYVKVVENRGRDVAPMVVTFAEELQKYDYVCHIHTKKSLYTGNEQVSWRKHLLDNLLGSFDDIRKIFSLFSRYQQVGIIYPETVNSIPYWGHTWLTNKENSRQLLEKLNIPMPTANYIDYPAGTMFWARVDAIKPLLSMGLKLEDFPEENKQTDGTLAHSIERCLVQISKHHNMGIVEVNFNKGYYRLNIGGKNLYHYWNLNQDTLKSLINNSDLDVLSLDIFDTIITRPVLEPDTVFKLIEIKIKKELNLNFDFPYVRKLAENEVRRQKNYKNDVSIDEIYVQISKEAKLSNIISEKIKELEIQTEIDLCMARTEMTEIMKESYDKGIKVVLISDMYLKASHIKMMLDKLNITYYHEIWVSSETQMRKDTGEIWGKYIQEFNKKNTLHIGDNEQSDIQKTTDLGLANFHTMSGFNLFMNSQLGFHLFGSGTRNLAISDEITFGLIASKIFNSPFSLYNSDGVFKIKDYKTLGFVVFGPIIFNFNIWLLRELQKNEVTNVLFLAREGHFLVEIFNKLYSSYYSQLMKLNANYLLASRRAISVPTIKDESDILELLKENYNGDLFNLLISRFGLQHEDIVLSNRQVNLPKDHDVIKNIVLEYKDEIIRNAQTEKKYYLNYFDQLGVDLSKKTAVVDLGYSGTIQHYLSKLLDKPIEGYYFATSDKQKSGMKKGTEMFGCFADKEDYLSSESAVYKYHLLLESILTSPNGQFIRFKDENLAPIYGEKGHSQIYYGYVEEVHHGISEYIDEAMKYFKDYLQDIEFTNDNVQKLLEIAITDRELISDDVKSLFVVEDNYCSSGEITVFDFYKNLFNI